MEHKELKTPRNTDAVSLAFATFTRSALQGWQTDPVFEPYFHETGFIVAGHTPALIEHIKNGEIDQSEADFEALESAEDFRRTMRPGVLTGDFSGWKGWISLAVWVMAWVTTVAI